MSQARPTVCLAQHAELVAQRRLAVRRHGGRVRRRPWTLRARRQGGQEELIRPPPLARHATTKGPRRADDSVSLALASRDVPGGEPCLRDVCLRSSDHTFRCGALATGPTALSSLEGTLTWSRISIAFVQGADSLAHEQCPVRGLCPDGASRLSFLQHEPQPRAHAPQ